MNRTTIVSIAVALIALGGIVWFARPESPSQGEVARPDSQTNNAASPSFRLEGQERLRAEEASFDFGAISMGKGIVKHAFKIKNASNEPVTILKIYTSCMCTTATLTTGGSAIGSGQVKQFGPYGMPGHGFVPKINKAVGAGEEATIEVAFDPAAHGPAGVGSIERAVVIEQSGGRPLELRFTALVTP
jgi:hypothetical protein